MRPITAHLDGLTTMPGTVLKLPFNDNEVPGLTTMCVLEHIGLGRYGDPINPNGTEDAVAEIARVIAPRGIVIYSVPVGRDLLEFNANRRFRYEKAKSLFKGWEIVDTCILAPDPVAIDLEETLLQLKDPVACFCVRKPSISRSKFRWYEFKMKTSNLFGYPILGRAGLGNMLFPWARCFLWCHDQDLPMVAPIWTKLRIGPYLRGERDKRNYQALFNNHEYVNHLSRLFLLAFANQVSEEKSNEILRKQPTRNTLVLFKGMDELFKPLYSRHAEIFTELRRITKPKYIDTNLAKRPFIGIHIRRGDFSIPTDANVLREGNANYQIPIEWYVSVLNSIRNGIGFQADAVIFSDGPEEGLKELLQLPNIKFFRGGTAVTDLIALAESRAIIASGSTFSMWASFLGQVPSVWYPGQRRGFLIDSVSSSVVEPEIDYGMPVDQEFAAAVYQRFMQVRV